MTDNTKDAVDKGRVIMVQSMKREGVSEREIVTESLR